MLLGRNPTLVAAAIRAVILCAVTFGLRWSVEQIAAVMLAVEAIFAVIVRDQVTPVGDPRLPVGTSVNAGTAVVSGPDPVPVVPVDQK